MSELAEMLDQVDSTLEVDGQRLRLCPLNLNDLIELEEAVGEGRMDSLAAIRYELFLCARKGGYAGTLEELGAMLLPGDVLRARIAMAKLYPPSENDSPNAGSPEGDSGLDSSGA